MAVIVGRNARVAESATDSGYTEIGKIMSVAYNFSNDIADSTSNDSAGFKEGEYADAQMTLEITCRYDRADTSQIQLIDDCNGKNKRFLRFRPEATSGQREFRAQYTIDSFSLDTSTGDVEEVTFSCSSSGAVTIADQ